MQAFYKLSWIPSLMVIVGLMFITSCKDDEKPKAKIAFTEVESELLESDGTIDVTITLDKAASETIVLSYSLAGTATKFGTSGGDYEINPDGGTITIPKGESEVDIEIEVLDNDGFEVNLADQIAFETVVITITGIVSGPGELGTENLVHTVSIFEDDMLIVLTWDGSDTDDTDVDMDFFIWFDDPEDAVDDLVYLGGSATEGTDSEGLIIPSFFPDTDFGFSYVYYSGTDDDLDFEVNFINFGGTVNGDAQATSTGNYGLVNINKYDEEDAPAPQIIQTTVKNGVNYTNLSNIDEPATGSRQRVVLGSFGDVNPASIRHNFAAKKITLPQGFLKNLRK